MNKLDENTIIEMYEDYNVTQLELLKYYSRDLISDEKIDNIIKSGELDFIFSEILDYCDEDHLNIIINMANLPKYGDKKSLIIKSFAKVKL